MSSKSSCLREAPDRHFQLIDLYTLEVCNGNQNRPSLTMKPVNWQREDKTRFDIRTTINISVVEH